MRLSHLIQGQQTRHSGHASIFAEDRRYTNALDKVAAYVSIHTIVFLPSCRMHVWRDHHPLRGPLVRLQVRPPPPPPPPPGHQGAYGAPSGPTSAYVPHASPFATAPPQPGFGVVPPPPPHHPPPPPGSGYGEGVGVSQIELQQANRSA